jgi:hypothetical protein
MNTPPPCPECGSTFQPTDVPGWLVLTAQQDGSWQPDWDGKTHPTETEGSAALAEAQTALGTDGARLAVLRPADSRQQTITVTVHSDPWPAQNVTAVEEAYRLGLHRGRQGR